MNVRIEPNAERLTEAQLREHAIQSIARQLTTDDLLRLERAAQNTVHKGLFLTLLRTYYPKV